MKKLILLFIFAFYLNTTIFAQDANITFSHATWNEILTKAQAEDKIIFMDAYTTWCGPCKKMSRDVFTNKEVSEFFNSKFINVKMDMERGEGVSLSEKYNVVAYPTLLFIGGDGEVVHRSVGYHTTDQLIELGQTVETPAKTLSGMKSRFEFGDRSPEFLYEYTFVAADAMDGSHAKVAEAYLETQKDWKVERNSTFLFRFMDDTDSEMFDYFLANKDHFVGLFGETPISRKLQYMINASVEDNENESALEQVAKLYKKVYPEKAEKMTSNYKMMYYLRAGDVTKYVEATKTHIGKFGSNDWENLNETAWNFYEFVDNPKDLKLATKWAKKSTKIDKNFYNMDTLAALYYKLGKKKKAIKTAESAISIAKNVGEDYSSTQELLQQIMAM